MVTWYENPDENDSIEDHDDDLRSAYAGGYQTVPDAPVTVGPDGEPTANPTPKVVGSTVGAGVGAALAAVLVWLLTLSGLEVPEAVQGAFTVLLSAVVAYVGGWITPPGARR